MKKRRIVTGIAIVPLLAATAGIAFAAGRGSSSGTKAPIAHQMVAACDAMHDSPARQAMHDRMPAALQASCDAMYEEMDHMVSSMMDGSGMISGSSMMDGSAATTSGSMADHHPSTEG